MYKVLKTCKFAFEPWEKQLSLTKDEMIDLPEAKAALLLHHGIIKEDVIEAETKMLEPDEDKSIKLTYKKNKKNKRVKK